MFRHLSSQGNSLRVAHDREVAAILDLLDTRRSLFAEPLERANELLRSQAPTEEDSFKITECYGTDTIDWDEFLQ